MIAAASLALGSAGCGVGNGGGATAGVPVDAPAPVGANGRVMGGEQAINGAVIKVWRVNTDGTAATNILTQPVTTDSNGFFTLTGLFSCTTTPTTNSSEIYLTAMGGNSGGLGINPGIALMAALGPCGSLTAGTFILVNEVTTVASVWALQNFIGATLGVAGADDVAVNTQSQSVTGMQNAFATVPVLVSIAQGAAVTSYANATIESAKINTIANILTTCVNSNGTGNCADLFAAVTPSGKTAAADTIQAAWYIAQNPSNNVAQIYNFMTGIGAPFSPNLSAQPFDWTLGVVYQIGSSATPVLPYYMAADAGGHIWVVNPISGSPSLVELGTNGQAVSGSPFLGGTSTPLDIPSSIAVDTVGDIWVSNNKTSSGYNDLVSFPGTGSSYSQHFAPSGCDPVVTAMDGNNNAWFACAAAGYFNLYEFANTGGGTPSYGSNPTQYQGFAAANTVSTSVTGLAVDTTGNIWVAHTDTLASSTAYSVTEYPAGFTTATTPTTYALGGSVYNLAVDHSGNVWTSGSGTLYELAKSGSTYSVSSFSGGGLNSARYLAVDGNGNLWIANGAVTTIPSGTGTSYISVSEFNNNGTAMTLDNQTDIPGGYPVALPSSLYSANNPPTPRGIAIDPSGNVWMAGCAQSTSCNSGQYGFVMELVGAATPPVTPIAAAIAGNYLGCCDFTPATPGGTVVATPGYLTLQASTFAPMQDGNSLSFLVTRTGGSNGAVAVNYATSNGTATAGTDYTSTSGTLNWSSGDSTVRTITVPWLNMGSYPGNLTFTLTLNGATGGASISPYATTAVSVSTQVTSAVIAAGTYPWFTGLTPPFYLTPPSNHFSVLNGGGYYEGLPVDVYGGYGGVGQIQFQSLGVYSPGLTGYSSPYFYLNASNQIVFTAPSNGAVTSPGSGTDDARSELRELYTGAGHDSNSDWYGNTNGSNGGTMTGTCQVMAQSVDTDEATFAQIHGQNNPFVLLIYRAAYKDVEISLLTTSAATTTQRTELATGVILGDVLSYSLTYTAPSTTVAGTVTVWVKDVTQGNSSLGTVTIPLQDNSWSSQGMYFKLGAYSGANHIGNPASDYTQVVYTNWAITH
jgi:hypothetical protein